MNKLFYTVVVLLSAIGAINWGLVGGFNFNLVAFLFGAMSTFSRIIYVLVGISGVLLLLGIKNILDGCTVSSHKSVGHKQKISDSSPLKSSQNKFINEGGNSQPLK